MNFNDIYSSSDNSRYWKNFETLFQGLSLEEKKYVSSQKEVAEANGKMFEAFIAYLFEQNKDAFVSVNNGMYRNLADSYINAVQKAVNSYVPHTEELEKENQAMKRRIQELERQNSQIRNRNNGKNTAPAE